MTYPGGKNGSGVYQKIINQIPPHEAYIEPFLGHGAVMLRKKPAHVNIGIDSDDHVVEHWRALIAANNDERSLLFGSVNIINGDAISYLQKMRCARSWFVYADPPYLMETRSSKRPLYKKEFGSIEQHTKLLKVLKSLPCMVAISGYQSPLYISMLMDWRSISYKTVNRAGNVVTEWLWMNYPEPLELHDYGYLGENFRERERLKRIKTRWLARLGRMDRLERYMLLSSIAEYADLGSPKQAMSAVIKFQQPPAK